MKIIDSDNYHEKHKKVRLAISDKPKSTKNTIAVTS
tara:strand:- start:417 stop:524 length:108 start_codon:yes stop_codon:yes gene_type:complete